MSTETGDRIRKCSCKQRMSSEDTAIDIPVVEESPIEAELNKL